ncbi:hypothetical protein [Amycolatopsis sacchari]|uniref:hypothetical protein n=1 Tax=Amycolatopsis sacchari TaxID=115433 RepID=UPI003D71EAB6
MTEAGEGRDVARLLRVLAVRAFVLAVFAALAGLTTVAMALALVGCGLLFARSR